MTTKPVRERISADGLRYGKKLPNPGFRTFKSTRSCFACSGHHLLSEGLIVSLMGRCEFFCSQACKEKIIRPKAVPSPA